MPTVPTVVRRPETRHLVAALIALAAATSATACRSPAPAGPTITDNTWAIVDGREITRDAVEKAYTRSGGGAQPLSVEEALTAKLTLLNDLILQDLLLAKAGALKIEIPANELDAAYAEAKKNIPEEAFQQELTRRGVTVADMREGLRRELVSQKVIEREVQSKVAVTEPEVTAFFDANRAQFNFPEEAYHIAQIVVTPVREAQPANRTGDDAATPEAAAAKAQMLMQRLKAGAAFADLAMDYSEDPNSAPRGGDLGFLPMSRLKQAPPRLRDAVLKVAVGTVSLVSEGGNHTIVAVVAYEPAGQRDLSTPAVRESITSTLRARKEQLLRAAYLTAVRGDATVVNYLARRLVESQGKAPSLGLAPPAAPPAAK
jgi:peptidyl-prolyl cis-trans isomerase SurA